MKYYVFEFLFFSAAAGQKKCGLEASPVCFEHKENKIHVSYTPIN